MQNRKRKKHTTLSISINDIEIVSRIAREKGMSAEDADEILTHFWRQMDRVFLMDDMPDISITRVGCWRVTPKKMVKLLKRAESVNSPDKQRYLEILHRKIKETYSGDANRRKFIPREVNPFALHLHKTGELKLADRLLPKEGFKHE